MQSWGGERSLKKVSLFEYEFPCLRKTVVYSSERKRPR